MKIMAVLFTLIVAALFIVMYMFATQSIGSSDMGVNLSGTTYEEAYNFSTNTSRVGMNFIGFVPPFLGIAGLIAGLFLILTAVKMR